MSMEGISPAIDVSTIDAESGMFGGDPEAPALQHARQAMQEMRDRAQALAETEAAISTAPPDPVQRQKLKRLAAATLSKARARAEQAMQTLAGLRERADADIAAVMGVENDRQSLAANARAGEIRTFLRNLSDDLRDSTVQKAVTQKDREILSALFGAPSILSGVTREQAAVYRPLAERAWARPQFDARIGIDRLNSRLMAALAALNGRFGKLAADDAASAESERRLASLSAAIEGGQR
jgi:hypothetical protein